MAGMGEEKAIGIDLGTTYSCVGVWQHDRIEIIPNEQGNRTTPSMVAFNSTERLVGDAAMFQISTNPRNTVFDTKRLIGRRFTDPCVQSDIKVWPFAVVKGKDDKPMVEVSYKGEKKLFAAEEISSLVLMKMKMIAEQYLNCNVNDAVITVPAYFNNSQRQATIDAGKIAGLNVMRIIPEPTAAAITYGLDASNIEKKNVLIFDLGGGTFDASVLTVEKGKIYVKAIAGDMHLGGEDFDNRMVNYCVEQFNRKFKLDLSTSSSPKALRRLRSESERAKRCLSSALETVIDIDSLYEGQDFHMKITRVKFEKLNADLFQKCMETVKKCLVDAKMEKHQIEEVVLVGGSSRIPKVQELLRQFFGEKNLCKSVNPDEAVAYGAAMQAAFLNNEPINLVLVDVTPLSLGISVSNGVMKAVVSKNTPIPTRMETIVTTMYDNQVGVHFKVYEGERALVAHNYFLDEFLLHGIPPAPCGVPNINVCFEVDADGILKVLAQDQATGLSNGITIYKEREMQTKEEMDRMVSEAKSFQREDEEAMKKHLAKHNLECYICNMRERVTERTTRGRKKKRIAENVTRILNDVEEWLDENYDTGLDELIRKLEELKTKIPPIPVQNL